MKKPALLTTLVLSAGIVRCVGDSSNPDGGGMDATTDATGDVANTDAGDAGMEAAPKPCSTFPEGGTAGTLDPGFTAQFYSNIYNGEALAIDAKGSIYVGGWDSHTTSLCGTQTGSNAAYVVKAANNGALSTTFGSVDGGAGGVLCIVAPGYSDPTNGAATTLQAMATDPDGTLVAVGFARDRCGGLFLHNCQGSITGTKAFVARFTPSGALDTTFNMTGPGAPGILLLDAIPGDRSSANAVAIDTSFSPAKIVVAGSNDTNFGWYATKSWVTRLNHDGSQDAIGFSASPIVDSSTGGYDGVTVLNSDIYVTGAGTPSPDGGVYNSPTGSVRKVLGSGTNHGTFDPTFGGGNPVPIFFGSGNFGTGEGVASLAGKTSVAVAGFGDPNLSAISMTAIAPDGSVDTTFGDAGTMPLVFGGGSPAFFGPGYQFGLLTLDCERRLLVSATVLLDAGANYEESLVARVLTNGSLDSTFGQSGFGGVGAGFNSSAVTAALEDPVTGGIVVVLRRRGMGLDGQVGLVRLYR